MTVEQLIHSISKSHQIGDVFGTSDWRKAYRSAVMLLHPDRCLNPAAAAALIRLNELRAAQEHGLKLYDDAGELRVFGENVRFEGDTALLSVSAMRYEQLSSLRNPSARHFKQYLPGSMAMNADNHLVTSWPASVIPLSGRVFPLHHVNWILSRLLEFCAWLAQEGFVHAGLHPESVCIVPKTHGIKIISFYHLQRRGAPLKTVSAAYQHWYPTSVFRDKCATSFIDIEMSKRLAAYLLGDPSGTGVALRGRQPPEMVDFLLATHTDAYQCYDAFRQLLTKHHPAKFHPLMA